MPSPCGPNSQCKEINKQAVCSCLAEFVGAPPNCRPECVVSSECQSAQACVNQRCVDPCIGSCGQNANCNVINHSPICVCKQGLTGNPFTQCYPIKSKWTIIIIIIKFIWLWFFCSVYEDKLLKKTFYCVILIVVLKLWF